MSGSKGSHVAGHAEGPVVEVASGASGDLAELGGIELAKPEAVELPRRGEGDVIDIHVQAHADGIRRDEEVDVARLVERDLGIAGARRQGAHDDGGTAALAADQLGDGIDALGREG